MSGSQISSMLQQMAAQDEVLVSSRMMTVTKLARLTLVAEQFGFMYVDARQTGGQAPKTVLLLLRDPSPEAHQRAVSNWRQFPNAGNGGDLPGMQPGGKLSPLPEAGEHLELLQARIKFDLTGKNSEKRIMAGAAGIGVWTVYRIIRESAQGESVLGAVIIGVVLLAIIGGGFLWNRRRNTRFAAVLASNGLTKVTDESGRARYMPPGSRLPGQQTPFAMQQPPPRPQQQPYPGQPQPYPGQQVPQQQMQAPYGGPHMQQPPQDYAQQPPQQPYAGQQQYPQQPHQGQQPYPGQQPYQGGQMPQRPVQQPGQPGEYPQQGQQQGAFGPPPGQ